MKTNDIFTFITPNKVEVTAIVVDVIKDDKNWEWYLCYSQNRLFHYQIITGYTKPIISVAIDYCIIPDYDIKLGCK